MSHGNSPSASSRERAVWADYDERGVVVYQAFKPSITAEAVRLQRFGKGFNRERMTWIKPSLGWMLHRSAYATKKRMQSIVGVRLRHDGFREILRQAISTSFEPGLYRDEDSWRDRLGRSRVRYQWDPDRDLSGRPLSRRALQLGIRGAVVSQYVDEWTVEIVERTALAHAVRDAYKRRQRAPAIPEEREYPLDASLRRVLAIAAG